MANFNTRQSGPAQAARPSAAEAKATEERYSTFQNRMSRLAEAANQAGRATLANQLVDLGQRVEDREITLEEGMEELRDYGVGATILTELGVRDMVLLTNIHHTLVGLEGYGLSIVGERPIPEDH